MAESGSGIVITQTGVPVQGSADYQRVFDSRWRFIEIEIEREFNVILPARNEVDSTVRGDDRINFYKHGLGFVPLFETDFVDQKYNYAMQSGASMYADEQYLFFQRFVTTTGAEAQDLTFNVRLYNLPVLEDYTAPKGLPQGTQSPRSNIGVKFLDGNTKGVDVADNAVTGFSVDTTKKILSIHKHGRADINDFAGRYVYVSDLNTTTDVLTLYADPYANSLKSQDISWVQTAGTPVFYSPNDFTTYPGGTPITDNGQADAMYIIPVDATHVKLAASYENALAGIAINFTTSGSNPAQLSMGGRPDGKDNAIQHDVGYPPTYLMAPVYNDFMVNGVITEVPTYIGPLEDIILAYTSADEKYIYFKGVQSQFAGSYGYVIMKDPAELAR